MTGGYTGKILRVNLGTRAITRLDTAKYEEFGGGYGIGAAIFWELAVAPGGWNVHDAFHPRNVLCLMSGPLAATGVPGAGRTSVCGLAPESYPSGLFYRANFGGRFATTLKLAGWDGIVLEGNADQPVWINIINDAVVIEDAASLWGLNTFETQDRITGMVGGRTRFGDEWLELDGAATTARPQIVCIGPVGEACSKIASLVHGSGINARTGGYGAVFGAKKLKAISVLGTGSVAVADPGAIVDARIGMMRDYPATFSYAAGAASCMPCLNSDRRRNTYYGGEAMCADTNWFLAKGPEQAPRGADIATKWGLSTWGAVWGGRSTADVPGAPALFHKSVPDAPGLGWYIKYLYDLGVLGPGKRIDSAPLPMELYGDLSFREAFCEAIAKRQGIGDALADGTFEAAEKWGRLQEDLDSGALRFPAWGNVYHWILPCIEWSYGTLLGAGDIVWHGMTVCLGRSPLYTIETLLEIMARKTIPFTDDPFMFSYAWQGADADKTGIYSPHKAKQFAWTRRYAGFWNESMALCELTMPSFTNSTRKDFSGPTPDIEMRYYQAVTGNKISFADTMEIGRKIWNLERAIRVMQGRHRDQEVFAPFMYRPGASHLSRGGRPVYENGKWSWQDLLDLYLDKGGVERFKSHFFELEGWDVATGWPTRRTLEGVGLDKVADVLGASGKLP